MKRKFTFLMAAFTLLTMMASTGMSWATDVTFSYEDYKGQGTQSSGSEYTMVKTDVSITNTKFYGNNSYAHFYANGTTTITPADGVTITGIVLTASAPGYNGFQSNGTITASTGTISGSTSSTTVTWTGSAAAAFTISNNKQIRWTSIVVTYNTSGGTPTVATPTFDPAAGTYTEAKSVTITSETDGATIYYTTDGTTPTTESSVYSSPLTISETTTVKAMATKENMNNSSVASATYTINLPYSGPAYVRVDNVSYLTEGVKVILAARFDTEHTTQYYAMTNGASGKPVGTLFTSTTSGELEVLPASILDSESSYYWTVGITDNDCFTFTNADNQTIGWTSNSGASFTNGSDSYTEWTVVRNTAGTNAMVPNYLAFNIVNYGYTSRAFAMNNTHAFGPYHTDNINTNNYNFYIDIFVQGAEPVLTPSISANNVEIAYDATSGSFDFTLNNPVDGGQLSVEENVDWIEAAAINTSNGYSVTFETTVNQTATAREGIITLTYTYGDSQTATKDVTIIQAGNPNVFDNISSITGAGNYRVKGMVVATSSKGFIIGDGTGYVYTYLNAAPSYGIGDNLSITGTTSTNYGHVIQFTSDATIATVEETNYNGDPQPEVITVVPDYSEGNHLSTYLEFEGTLSKTTNGSTYYNVVLGNGQNSQIRISYPTTGQATELDALVSKTVRVHGFFTGISVSSGNSVFTAMMESVEEVVSTEPSITIATYELNVDAEAHENGTIEVTYANVDYESGEVMLCDANGEAATYDWIQSYLNDEHNINYSISANEGEARTAYLKVCIYEDYPTTISFSSDIVTITQAAYEAPATTGTIVFGNNGTKINAASVTGDDSMGNTWTITTVGTTSFTQNAAYSQVGKSSEPATSITFTTTLPQEATITAFSAKFGGFSNTAGDVSLLVDETEVGTGSLNGNNDVTVENTATEAGTTLTVTVTNIDKGVKCYYISYTISLGTDPIINVPVSMDLASDATEGEFTYSIVNPVAGVTLTAASTDEWISNIVVTDDKVTFATTENTETTERQGTITVSYEGAVDKTVTVNQAAYVPPVVGQQFALFGGNLVEGDYIIYYDGKAMNNVVNSGRLQYAEIEPEDNVITTDNAAIVWHIAPNDEGYWTIYSADANAYAASTGVKNKAQMLEDGTDDMAMWTVSEISGTYDFVNKANAAGDVNANLRNNGTYGFACYANTTGGALSLYKYTETVVTYTKEFGGYGNSTNGGYYLIASPVLGVTPAVDNGFLTDAYDLYYFDQAQSGEEWRNYEAKQFNIATGKGYLYASQEATTLIFTGAPYSGNGQVTLSKDANDSFGGWNLIGNPFSTTAVLKDATGASDKAYYKMNGTGTDLEAGTLGADINAMEGVFVIADNDGDEVTFVTSNNSKSAQLSVNVNNGTATIDRAIVRFDEGGKLPKFQLNPDNTKLYFTQGNKDFAVVRSANEGEMPVNFKAETNGNYTISVNAENVEMNYLHLIDNVTGADVDLLATPSYSFEANTNDYATRFRLVFKANANVPENADADTFAFFNGSTWTVSNLGEATLQVVDMTGRVLSSEIVNGNAEISINQTPGVYMLRLINGENVKVQKVVVR